MWMRICVLCVLVYGSIAWENPLELERHDLGTEKLDGVSGHFFLKTVEVNGTKYYRELSDARWTFDIPEGSYIMLNSEYFELEDSQDCMFDSLAIDEDGTTRKFCGYGHFVYISHGNQLKLHFASDESYEGLGFNFNFDVFKKDDIVQGYCNASILGGGNGNIYNNGEHCYTRVEATPGQFVRLNLEILNLGSKSCEEESVKIYKGITNHGELVKTICSGEMTGPLDVSEAAFFVEYHRAHEIEDNVRFSLAYSFENDPLPTAPAPVTTMSPVGGDNDCSGFHVDRLEKSFIYEAPHFENDRECILVVRNTHFKNHVIQVTFEEFDMEEIENCTFDYLKVISGERMDSQPLGGPYCGSALNGRTFVTFGSSLRLEFKTDESLSFYGLRAKIEFVKRTACSCDDDNKVCVRIGFEKRCLTGQQCAHSPCQNGGTCVVTPTSSQCYCRAGFAGENCAERQGNARFIQFSTTPEDRVFTAKGKTIEECSVEDAGATYVWTLNGDVIPPYNSKSGFGVFHDRFLKIDEFDDRLEGDYSCIATVGGVSAETYFTYTMVEQCLAVIEQKPEDKVQNVGDLVTFVCSARRAQRVFWNKNGNDLKLDNLERFSLLPGTNILVIENAVESDAGEYTCVAADENGCQSSRSARLTVTNIDSHTDYCGKSIYDKVVDGKISQGTEARPGDFPWQVTLFSTKENRVFCGGSVISKKFVLTAAHCITDKYFKHYENVELIFGTTNCNDRDASVKRFPIKVTVHDRYDEFEKFNNDIALIELNEEITYGDFIRPICLQRNAEFYRKVFFESTKVLGTYGVVAGCGKSIRKSRNEDKNAMKYVSLPYKVQEECEENYDGIKGITENMFCAGFKQRYKGDACQGDSGGAFVMNDGTRWYQTGIVSFGKGCDGEFYSVFTHVGNFYEWIRGISKFDEEESGRFLK